MSSKSNRLDFAYTLRDKPVMRGYVTPVRDGICFGIKLPERRDIHLIIIYKDGKIRTHIKESGAEIEYVYGRNYTPDILLVKLEKRINGWTKSYHANNVVWVMTPFLQRRISNAISSVIRGETNIRLEGVFGQIAFDFWHKRRWKRIRIKDMSRLGEGLGFRLDKGKLFMVHPLDEKSMLRFTERQAIAILNLVFDYLGFLEYFNYLNGLNCSSVRQ